MTSTEKQRCREGAAHQGLERGMESAYEVVDNGDGTCTVVDPASGTGWVVKAAADLEVDDWFIDPRREGRRPAKVVNIYGVDDEHIHLTLDDNTRYGTWAASYPTGEVLELVGDPQ